MTISQPPNEAVDLALLQNWDKQKTLPVQHNRQNSSKKRKSEKRDRKSECKNNKKLRTMRSSDNCKNSKEGSSKKAIKYELKQQYNQSLAGVISGSSINSLHNTQTVTKNPVYSTIGSQNISSNSSHGTNSKQMKSQLSKRMIKNFVNAKRENETIVNKFEAERTNSNDRNTMTYRKVGSAHELDSESKRPKSSLDSVSKQTMSSKVKKRPTAYKNPNDISNDPRVPKTKVKVYKYTQNALMGNKSELNLAKSSLKSKSTHNLMVTATSEERKSMINYQNLKSGIIKASDLYAQNFSSTEYLMVSVCECYFD